MEKQNIGTSDAKHKFYKFVLIVLKVEIIMGAKNSCSIL